ncbi:MAG: DUF4870 domain-containing protein [Gemmatimonadales bacterium]|nr:MAG: DUF4870 domain-containing protein [Gemmatimonadales bacterium]
MNTYDPDFDTSAGGAVIPREARTWAMLSHVSGLLGFIIPIVGSIFGPLVVWLLKRETHPFVDDQGREALNFQINIFIYYFLAGLLVLLLVGILVLLLIPVYQVVMILVAAIKSQEGETFRYPLILRFF